MHLNFSHAYIPIFSNIIIAVWILNTWHLKYLLVSVALQYYFVGIKTSFRTAGTEVNISFK